ncbi:hypothetical protein ACP70R_014490 [Stipagrostis hirtigluma subsp. patula]
MSSPPADSRPLTSQQEGAEVDAARRTEEEVDRLLAKLKNAAKEIDHEIAGIRIRAQCARETIVETTRNDMDWQCLIGLALITFASGAAVGYYVGRQHGVDLVCKNFYLVPGAEALLKALTKATRSDS